MQFNWTNPYPTVRSPVMARNVVATSQPLAAQAGLRMLQKAAMRSTRRSPAAAHDDRRAGVQRPGQRQLRHPVGRPAAARPEFLRRGAGGLEPGYFRQQRHGGTMPMRGWDTVTTPGAVAGWVALSERFGKLPFADLMEPAIELAERGHGVATHRGRQVGACRSRCCRTCRDSPRPSCRAGGRRCRASASCSPRPARRCARSRPPRARPSTAARSPRSWWRMRRPTAAA
jgi:hypothetical protein